MRFKTRQRSFKTDYGHFKAVPTTFNQQVLKVVHVEKVLVKTSRRGRVCMCGDCSRCCPHSLGQLGKAGLAEGRSVAHLQHAVAHHFCEHGGPQAVQGLALHVGLGCLAHQILKVEVHSGGATRRLRGALL